MMLPLQIWLIENYTKPGEVVLDPMAGSGTCLVGCSMGRHVICCELEQKFVRMMVDNWEKVKQRGPMMGCDLGDAVILWGDSRDILKAREHPYQELWLSYPKLDYPTIKAIRRHNRLSLKGDARNLEGLLVDKIITSPPYAKTDPTHFTSDRITSQGRDFKAKRKETILGEGYSKANNNIGNLPYGEIDSIITSPPYAGREQFHDLDFIAREQPTPHRPQKKQADIGQLPYGEIGAVITSPPYEATEVVPGNQTVRSEGLSLSYPEAGEGYNRSNSLNIGNLKAQSYLDAMYQVYSSCFAVLRNSGLMILVVKPFIRNKEIVPLQEHTKQLAERAGFTFLEEHHRILAQQSFWRTIALMRCDHRKGSRDKPKCKLGLTCPVALKQQLAMAFAFQGVDDNVVKVQSSLEKLCPQFINTSPRIDREFVLVFRKQLAMIE